MGLLSALLLVPAQAQIRNASEAVDQAGLQRMLGQRILKDYGLVALGIKVSAHQKALTDTIKRYQAILSDLQSYPAAAEATEIMGAEVNAWEKVKRIAAASPQKDKMAELYEATEELLQANEALVKYLVEQGHVKSVAIVAVSGRQRMLSQRMAALYNLKVLGLDEETFAENLENAAFEFLLGLEELKGSDLNDRLINAELKKVGTQFKMLNFSVQKKGDTYFPFVVSRAAEKILEQMIKITAEYVNLLGSS